MMKKKCECNVLEFTVSANTDVGNSGLSEKTVKGFPKSKTKYMNINYQLYSVLRE